ncbi:Protein phosphatase 2C 55 [Actinidia chinensis var. chinensis]|uniref:Protein phosphatase n=1 Tax=Actinidia chinensis var. chinensis TaxID=1590841 RepID=A0A2R6QVC5_ACTCC|nr:Protein phosphatase 2C 55 [Actinidia chinensis var. chinensis]
MVAGAFYIPKYNEFKPLGDDAHFVRAEQQTVGVADGVGGWEKKGMNGDAARCKYWRQWICAVRGGKLYANHQCSNINLAVRISLEILGITRVWLSPQPKELACSIAELALGTSLDCYARSPFAKAAWEAGLDFMGGKIDVITVVVAYIVSMDLA